MQLACVCSVNMPYISEGLTDKVMTSVELATRQATLEQTPQTINNIPTTPIEKKECSMRLTPQQMHQVPWAQRALYGFGARSKLRTKKVQHFSSSWKESLW